MSLDNPAEIKYQAIEGSLAGYEINLPRFQRTFTPHEVNNKLVTQELNKALCQMAIGDMVFPINHWPHPGRSLYTLFTPEIQAALGIHGIKMKGGAGLVRGQDSKLLIELPRPRSILSLYLEPHLSLSEDLAPRIIISQPKGINSLLQKNARREYEALERLSLGELSLRPLMWGEFKVAGKPDLDLNEDPTGVVFSEASQNIISLNEAGGFVIFHDPNDFNTHQFKLITKSPLRSLNELTMQYNALIEHLAATKRIAAQEYLLIRHVGHLDNAFIDRTTGRIILGDLDSVGFLDLDNVPKNAWASRFIRDIASDTLRAVTSLSYSAFSGAFLNMIGHESYDPFKSYLTGYFKKDLQPETIEAVAKDLRAAYANFLNENAERVLEIHMKKQRMYKATGDTHSINLELAWRALHSGFIGEVLKATLKLYEASDMSKLYPLPANVRSDSPTTMNNLNEAAKLLPAAYNDADAAYKRAVEVVFARTTE